jgi:hypothetical protein
MLQNPEHFSPIGSDAPIHLPSVVVPEHGVRRDAGRAECMDAEPATRRGGPTDRQSQVMAVAPVPLRALLAALDPRELRADAERLAVDDLRALGSFSAQPHPLVHRTVAVALALLLSLSPAHVDLRGGVLAVRPWAVLRLELLADSPALWRRLRARTRALETGNWVLSHVQIRFACQELLRFLLVRPVETIEGGKLVYELSLEPVARVSTIAAALSAWACMCLLHACEDVKGVAAPASPIKITLTACDEEKDSPRHGGAVKEQNTTGHRTKKEKRCHRQLPLAQLDMTSRGGESQLVLRSEPSACVSRRAALKVGGRYVLFHARVRLGDDSVEWSLFALDAHWNYSRQQSGEGATSHMHRELWFPFRPLIIQPSPEHSVTEAAADTFSLSRLPLTALACVLMQLACRAGMFRPRHSGSSLSGPVEAESIRNSTVLQSYFIVVTCDSMDKTTTRRGGWSITAVGRAFFPLNAPLSALRAEILAALVRDCTPQQNSTQEHQCAWDDFQFMYRSALLSIQLEESAYAAALLPVVMLVQQSHLKGAQKETRICKMSIPLRLQREVTERLINCGVQSHSQFEESTLTTEAMGVHQPVSSDNSHDHSTASIVTEILRNWESFVQLQRFQEDPTVIFQLSPKKKRGKNAAAQRRQSLEEFLASHEDGSDCKPKDTTPQHPRKVCQLLGCSLVLDFPFRYIDTDTSLLRYGGLLPEIQSSEGVSVAAVCHSASCIAVEGAPVNTVYTAVAQ